ncbi:hypothetical protein ASF34_01215 [Methylobacterium sp. Leaf106]|nr:hypothetical protein ASF34_01215 [Methylobacterium sp. Leaf106]
MPVVPVDFEAVTEADRRFFVRHPDRSHRVRHTSQAEMAQVTRSGSMLDAPMPGFRWFTAIRQVAEGVRVRVYVQAPELCDTDVSEAVAAQIYREVEGQGTRDLTARLVSALKKAGAM